MGIDFIRKSKRDFVKEWSLAMSKTTAPGLFDPVFARRRVIGSVALREGVTIEAGKLVAIDRCADGFRVSDGVKHIGQIVNPSSDLTSLLEEHDGNALGKIERLSLFNDMAEIAIHDPHSDTYAN